MALDRFRAAPLPAPPTQWDAQYMRQVIRVLENYFSQLDSRTPNNAEQYTADRFIGGLFSGDGTGLQTPYNEFYSLVDQAVPALDQAAAVKLENTVFVDGITIGGVNNTQITFGTAGVYLIMYSLSFTNPTNDRQSVNVWLRYNDGTGAVNVPNSNSKFTIPARRSTGDPSFIVAVTPYTLTVVAGGYAEIMWSTTDITVTMEHIDPIAFSAGVTPAIPGTPSAIVQASFVSRQV